MPKPSDQDLLQRIRDGDKGAFRELVERYKNVSFTLACSIMKDEQRAEDVLQDAFVKVFRHLKSFRAGAKFSTWLYRIVVNTAYTAIEKEGRHQSRQETTPAEFLPVEEEVIFNKLQQHERKNLIQAVFKQMKEEEALLLRLYYLAELSIKEIQETTGFSASKIKVGLHRARKSMLTHLRREMGDELKHLI